MAGSTVADLVGRVLAGRYRLLGAIGSGASGRVYVADDVRLRRRVAVKVLHAALADDSGFLRRFRSEAQLAASLHHPNVMAVYDWGEDGVPFMVLELLAGGSLRSMLDAGNRLSPAQSAHVGAQVAAALDYSHGRGLVHRDIKPANLLFDEHGIVRVADFGLARALAEASWTEPAGAVVGTARYAAPEQGTGAPLDGRADLYALGLVMVESITGSVPLVGDTALGTIGMRQDSLVELSPEVGALRPVLARACSADPNDRYPSADAMRNAIVEVGERMPPPGPLVLAGLGAVGEDPHPTQVVRPVRELSLFDQDQPKGAPPPGRPAVAARIPQRSRSAAPFLLGAVVAVAIAAAAFVLMRPNVGPSVTVPLLVGQSRGEAQQTALEANLLIDATKRASDDPKGTVIEQDPSPGDFLAERSSVHVVLSKGPAAVPLPELIGKTQEEATQLLQAQFAVQVVEKSHDTIPKGQIITSIPQGSAAPDSTVKLVVSSGPPLIVVPEVSGRGYDQAVARLREAGFGATRVDEFSDSIPIDKVIRSQPEAGQRAPKGSAIAVVVSKGPDLVLVPDFKGRTISESTGIGEVAGVELQASGVIGRGRRVRAQDPPPGASVKRGTVVTIFF
jgi:beta-lactam-binding protein with PASTA domain/tRNA A-37 threonylcarbamoyl transferase component Bud32